MKLVKWYQNIAFWTKIKYSVGLFGTGGTVTLALTNTPDWITYVAGGATLAGGLITIWFEDKNNNGKVDLFEDEKG